MAGSSSDLDPQVLTADELSTLLDDVRRARRARDCFLLRSRERALVAELARRVPSR